MILFKQVVLFYIKKKKVEDILKTILEIFDERRFRLYKNMIDEKDFDAENVIWKSTKKFENQIP